MQKIRFDEAVRAIRKRDDRFDLDGYCFLRDSLDYTVEKLRGDESLEHRHVSGRELLEGLRDYALQEFGPMAVTVLETWGIQRCEDIGHMVFQLIEAGAFGKSDEDRPEDFSEVFDFDEAFREPFRPKLERFDTPGKELLNRIRDLGSGKSDLAADAESGINQAENESLS